MLPRVILHNAVSLDGRTTGFVPDIALFYRLASSWDEDATLAGADTILTAAAGEGIEDEYGGLNSEPPNPGEGSDQGSPGRRREKPLLAITDSRGRVRCWSWLKSQPYWEGTVALCSKATPAEHLSYLARVGVDIITAGEDQVDLPAALRELAERFALGTVRADSGGKLNSALLRAGLVGEISLLLHPCLVPQGAGGSFLEAGPVYPGGQALPLRLLAAESLEGGTVWLRYEVA